MTAGSGFDPTGYIVGGMTFADFDGSGRQSIYLSYWTEELAGDPARQTVKGAFPGRTACTGTSGTTGSRTSPTRVGIGEYHADSFTAVFADFTGDIDRISSRPTTIGLTGSTGTSATDASRNPGMRGSDPCRQQHGRGDAVGQEARFNCM